LAGDRVFETLRGLGYEGGHDAVRRYARSWGRERASTSADAFAPLSFAPGEANQFDWSHEFVLIGGTTVTITVVHLRCATAGCCSPGPTCENAGDGVRLARQGLRVLQGRLHAAIYDNMQTAVDTIFVGRERACNRRFLQMCSHYLVDPVACTPSSGREKSQVENQVGLVRERFLSDCSSSLSSMERGY
jgi:transposase